MFKAKKSFYISLGVVLALVFISIAFMPYMIAGSRHAVPEIMKSKGENASHNSSSPSATIKVMTLNMAHGRGTGFNQLLLSKDQINNNLDIISQVLIREKPHIVGFQEADGPSFWSGGKDHLKAIAEKSDYGFSFHGYHIDAPFLSYGSAFASKIMIENAAYFTFSPAIFSPPKGFSSFTFKWPGKESYIDIIVLHLDFISDSKRNQQVDEIIAHLNKNEKRPLIVMGDFNSFWDSSDSSVRRICELLHLKAFRPEYKNLSSFPFSDKRIDWILISEQMDFVSYKIIKDRISDHLGVISEIGIND